MTAMSLTLLGNYAQTGHFGGPLAYTPYNVACHLAGPALGGLRYDLREPKFAYADKFMLAAGTAYRPATRCGSSCTRRCGGSTRRPAMRVSPAIRRWRCCR